MAGPQFFTPPIVTPSKPKKRFTLAQANKSLPLVSRIAADIVAVHQAASALQGRLETIKSSREQNKTEKELETKLSSMRPEDPAYSVSRAQLERAAARAFVAGRR